MYVRKIHTRAVYTHKCRERPGPRRLINPPCNAVEIGKEKDLLLTIVITICLIGIFFAASVSAQVVPERTLIL